MDENAINENNAQSNVENVEKVETESYKTFKTQKEFDDFSGSLRKQAEERALKNITRKDESGNDKLDLDAMKKQWETDYGAGIKNEVERQSKLTQAQRAKEIMEESKVAQDKREISLNKREVTNYLKGEGVDEATINLMANFVGLDLKKAMSQAVDIANSTKTSKATYEKALKEKYLNNTPNATSGSSNSNDYQAQYNKAKTDGNLALMTAISRNAINDGSTIRQ